MSLLICFFPFLVCFPSRTQSINSTSTDSITTLSDGNEPEGSFYLTYHCESSVNSTMVNVTQYSDILEFNDTGSVEVGDTLRVNTVEGSTGGITADWAYFTVSDINGTDVTVDTAADVDFADGYYYAEYGNFYSGPGLEYGVSTNCLQADPDFTNNPLDHDVSASDLQDELQGLAQVNSSAGCLEVGILVRHTHTGDRGLTLGLHICSLVSYSCT